MMWTLFCKALGAVLVCAAGGAAGWRKGEQGMAQARRTEEMAQYLLHIKDGLEFRCEPTRQALCRAKPPLWLGEPPPEGPDFPAAVALWLDGAKPVCPAQEWEWFAGALSALGTQDAQASRQQLAFAAGRLLEAARSREQAAKEHRRLLRTAGFALGAGLALFFL